MTTPSLQPPPRLAKGFAMALTAAVMWGISGPFGQFLFTYRQVNTEWLVTVRMLLSGVILLSAALLRRDKDLRRIWTHPADALQLLIFGVLGILGVQYTYFAAIAHSNAATATVLQYVGPVFIVVYMSLKRRQTPEPLELLAIVLAVAGTFLLVTHGNISSLSISGAGLAWGVAAAVALAFYTLQPISLLHRYSANAVIGWGMIIGGIALSFVHAPWQVEGVWDAYTWAFTAFIILLASVAAFSLYLVAVTIIGAERASLLASVEPLSATLVSVMWLKVPFSLMDWLGTLFILSTIFLLTRKKKTAGSGALPAS